jgi:high-affinity Fe2+/Pb2+ permease
MKLGFLSRAPWNTIILVLILLGIVMAVWWVFEKAPWLNP